MTEFSKEANRQIVILANAYMDVGGTIPWMESVESRLERRLRATHGDIAEARI